jgi:hypothetical protein
MVFYSRGRWHSLWGPTVEECLTDGVHYDVEVICTVFNLRYLYSRQIHVIHKGKKNSFPKLILSIEVQTSALYLSAPRKRSALMK